MSIRHILEVPGLFYIQNIIPTKMSADVISFLNNSNNSWQRLGNSAFARETLQYGYKYNYLTYETHQKIEDIPDILKQLIDLIPPQFKTDATKPFNQCIVNKYLPGQGISAHIDHRSFGPVISCFTFQSGGIMTFKDARTNSDTTTFQLYTEPNSLYIMTREARYNFLHSMSKTKTDTIDGKRKKRGVRISITFRHV